MVGRTLEASLNMAGERRIAFHDHLGRLIGIDMAQWWRPTAANYFDRVSKQVILDALVHVGGPELSGRFASVKKAELAESAERVFSGTYIAEADVRDRALAWVPEAMRFAEPPAQAASPVADAIEDSATGPAVTGAREHEDGGAAGDTDGEAGEGGAPSEPVGEAA